MKRFMRNLRFLASSNEAFLLMHVLTILELIATKNPNEDYTQVLRYQVVTILKGMGINVEPSLLDEIRIVEVSEGGFDGKPLQKLVVISYPTKFQVNVRSLFSSLFNQCKTIEEANELARFVHLIATNGEFLLLLREEAARMPIGVYLSVWGHKAEDS